MVLYEESSFRSLRIIHGNDESSVRRTHVKRDCNSDATMTDLRPTHPPLAVDSGFHTHKGAVKSDIDIFESNKG